MSKNMKIWIAGCYIYYICGKISDLGVIFLNIKTLNYEKTSYRSIGL
jgi:hypothetical protein